MSEAEADLLARAQEAAKQRVAALSTEAEQKSREMYIAPHMPISRFFFAAKTVLRQGRTYGSERDLERAYVLLLRFTEIVLNRLPEHPNFRAAEHAAERRAINKECKSALDEVFVIKAELTSQYAAEEEVRRAPVVPRF